jgi:Na+/melibiose symporter-like transporter
VTVTSLLCAGALVSAMVTTPFYFQIVRGEDATHTALLVAPVSIGVVLIVSRAGRLADRFGGGRIAIVGLLVGAISLFPFTMFDEHTPYALIIFVNVLRGLGFGACGTPLFAVAFRSLGEAHVRDGSAQINIVQRIGGSLGTAIATVILQRALTADGRSATGAAAAGAFRHTFWWLTGLSLLAIVPAIWLWTIERRSERAAEAGPTGPVLEKAPLAEARALETTSETV